MQTEKVKPSENLFDPFHESDGVGICQECKRYFNIALDYQGRGDLINAYWVYGLCCKCTDNIINLCTDVKYQFN